jgi:DMSO/TMAO reductase YedYZ heme-binding membrane subunit
VIVHVVTTLLDSFVSVSFLTFVVPYASSSYRRFWVMFGTLAFDGMLVAAISGFLRARTSITSWNWLHRSAYISWIFAFVHFLETGTDTTHGGWALYLDLACAVVIGGALTYRLSARNQDHGPVASLPAGAR